MWKHDELSPPQLQKLLRQKEILFAGWAVGKIYGHLDCCSGKRKIKPQNRVFFESEAEAISHGYRPCGACMKEAYKQWKKQSDISKT